MSPVVQSLDAQLGMQLPDSQLMFELAHTGYTEHGPGAMVTRFANVEALENKDPALSLFVPRTLLVKYEYEEVLRFVDMYDPARFYVALAIVDITKPKMGRNNAIMLCKMIHKDMCLVSPPNYDHNGGELRSATTSNITTQCSLKCARSGCGEANNLKICRGCNDARYCSKDCQIEDRQEHRQKCKKLKAAKQGAKLFLQSNVS
jgi:MYND finger